jgi:hypothetical protein
MCALPIERFKIMEKGNEILANFFYDNQFNNGWKNKLRKFYYVFEDLMTSQKNISMVF